MAISTAVTAAVPVPEPNLTPKELVARAEALRPMLLELQDETEERGHYSEAVHQEFLKAGFYRALQPRRFGGYEFDLPTYFRMVMAISRGCPSTGWCMTLCSAHVLQIGSHFSPEAQAEIIGPLGDFRAAHRASPGGRAQRVDDGWLINGSWDYASGVPWSTHYMGTCVQVDEKGEVVPGPMVVAVMPKGKFTIVDDWGNVILGMRGSGSNSVTVKDALIPENYVVPFDWMMREWGDTVGTRLHGNPLYIGRVVSFYHAELVAIMIGAAKAALDEYERIITTRKTFGPNPVLRYETWDHQQSFGLALGMVDAAEAIVLHEMEEYMTCARRSVEQGETFSMEEDLRQYAAIQNAGKLAWEAIELLFRTAGSTAAKNGQRMQRYFRDISVYRGHMSAQFLTTSVGLARCHFNLPPLGMPGA